MNDEVHSVRGCIGTDILLAAATHIWITKKRINKWTHWDLHPGPSACEADVIPLHHVPYGVWGAEHIYIYIYIYIYA